MCIKMVLTTALTTCSLILAAGSAQAATLITVDGSDAIFLAGRTDLVIPSASDPWPGGLIRHDGPTPEEIQETLPPVVNVVAGDIIRLADPAIGGISFFNGLGDPFYGPSGNGSGGSDLAGFGGISGYKGPQGALVGVFLDDSIPVSGSPATLNFTPAGLGTNFDSLEPELAQIFYIGDGIKTDGSFQTFIAPTGATRLFLGIADGFGFGGLPGAYDDNDGSYRVVLGINEIPSQPVPEPSSSLSLLVAGAIIGVGTALKKKVTT